MRKTKIEGRVEAIVVVSADGEGRRSQLRQQQKPFPFRGKIQLEERVLYSIVWHSESVATLPPFSPIEGQKWFDKISSQ
jgi:hypothetical protein